MAEAEEEVVGPPTIQVAMVVETTEQVAAVVVVVEAPSEVVDTPNEEMDHTEVRCA